MGPLDKITSLDFQLETVFVLALGTFTLVLVVDSAVGSELSLSFSDDMSQKGSRDKMDCALGSY